MASARSQAASTRSRGKRPTRLTMPRQERKPCSGCALLAQDDLDEGGGVRPDLAGLSHDALKRPVGIAPMARGHVLGQGRVPAVGEDRAGAQRRACRDGIPRPCWRCNGPTTPDASSV